MEVIIDLATVCKDSCEVPCTSIEDHSIRSLITTSDEWYVLACRVSDDGELYQLVDVDPPIIGGYLEIGSVGSSYVKGLRVRSSIRGGESIIVDHKSVCDTNSLL